MENNSEPDPIETPSIIQEPIPLRVVEYAGPSDAEWTPRSAALTRGARWFGAVPLALGCFDFLLWIIARNNVFAFFGLIIILIGVACTLIGAVILLIVLCSLHGTNRIALFWKNSWPAIAMLLINYPVAAFFIYLVIVWFS